MTSVRKTLIAVTLSAIVPGLGQLVAGSTVRAALFLASYGSVLILSALLRLPQSYRGLEATAAPLVLIAAVSAGENLFSITRALPNRPKRLFRVSLPVVLALTFLVSSYAYGLVFRLAGFRVFSVPSTSMEPTIRAKERIVVDSWFYEPSPPRRGDVVILRLKKTQDLFQIKRVTAVAGNTIEGRAGNIYLDGLRIEEPYAKHLYPPGGDGRISWPNDFGPVAIPNGKLFVMGDNRDLSFDSRSPGYGLIDVKAVAGRPLYIVTSDNRTRVGDPIW
ncbi:MAG: signal peptidase I [Acidobacteria bacterium]|nr:signal peptidase I [Acidobacteriota bacterium]